MAVHRPHHEGSVQPCLFFLHSYPSYSVLSFPNTFRILFPIPSVFFPIPCVPSYGRYNRDFPFGSDGSKCPVEVM